MEKDLVIFRKEDRMHVKDDIKSILKYGDYKNCPRPTISVIIPVYKRPDLFKQALSSVVNQKNAPEYEIIVVDNNDEGDVSPNYEIVKEIDAPNVFYYRHERNMGAGFSFNRGVLLAKGEYISFCHDDDMFMEDTLQRLWAIHISSNSDKCILSKELTIDMGGHKIDENNKNSLKDKLFPLRDKYELSLYDYLFGHGGFHTASLFNRAKFIEIGGYKVEYDPSGDYGVNLAYTYYYGCIRNNVPTFYLRKGENDSKTAYVKFVEIDKFFKQQIKEVIGIPKFLSRVIINITYKISYISFRIVWGGEPATIKNEIGLLDKILLRIVSLPLYKNRRIFFMK